MAKTRQQINKTEREKYRKDKKYREYKKEYRKNYEKTHEKQNEKRSKRYYEEHPDYRAKKIKQAKAYQKKKKK